mgnify:CR=1 FL=1
MATYELGKIGLNPRGAYSSNASYARLDVVSYNSSSYVALDNCTGVAPTDTSKWMLLAQGTSSETTSWAYPTLAAGTTPGDYGAGRMRYKKEGNHVIVTGSINIKPASSYITLFTLPENYRPVEGTTATVLKPCSGSRIARIAVLSNGTFQLEWVKNLSDGSNYTSASLWIECSIDFWIA